MNKNSHIIEARVKEVVLTGRIREEDAPAEGHITLEVIARANTDLKLECFLDYDDAIDFFAKKYVNGDRIKVELFLLGDYTRPVKLRGKYNSLTWIEKSPSLNPAYTSERYIAKGEVLSISPHTSMADSNTALLDCGIYVMVRLAKQLEIKVGDYIQMEGRLDAHIVGKVN